MLFGTKDGQNPPDLFATEQYLLFSTNLHLFRQFFYLNEPVNSQNPFAVQWVNSRARERHRSTRFNTDYPLLI